MMLAGAYPARPVGDKSACPGQHHADRIRHLVATRKSGVTDAMTRAHNR